MGHAYFHTKVATAVWSIAAYIHAQTKAALCQMVTSVFLVTERHFN